MAKNLTRRQLAAALAATPLLAQAPTRTQSPPTPPATSDTPADPVEKARAQARRSAEALNRVQLGMAVEPSFAFKP